MAPALAGGFFTTEAMSPEPFLWAKANMKQRLARPISSAVPGLGGAWWGPSLRASPVCEEDWGGVEIGMKLAIGEACHPQAPRPPALAPGAMVAWDSPALGAGEEGRFGSCTGRSATAALQGGAERGWAESDS